MRIGIDGSNLREGGGVTHLAALLNAAHPNEHGIREVLVWAGQNTLKAIPVRHWLRRMHETALDRSLPARLYWQTVRLPKLAKGMCDILFVPGGNYRGRYRPTVVMCRNMLPFKKAEMRRYGFSWMFVKLLLLRLSQSASYRNAEGVIFLNEHARSVVMGQKKNFKGQWRIIPHGIDKRFHLKPRAQRPLNAYSKVKPFRLLYVSKLHPYKHQWHVVEAVTRLRREGISIELDLVGSAYGSALRRLMKVVKRVDRDYDFIRYRGQVPYDNLIQYYHRADGFVFASSCENMPNIILEAMAAGLPIACSNREPMPEVLGDGGVYFNPESAEEIAEALKRLIMDSALRERCAQFAYDRAQQYSWRRCSQNTLDFLVQVANSG